MRCDSAGTGDEYEDLDEEELEGAYWRWADYAVPVRSAGGWSLQVEHGRIARWSMVGTERRLSVEEWMYECFCAHLLGQLTLERPGTVPKHLPGAGSAAHHAPLLELIGLPISSAELKDRGQIRVLLGDGTLVVGHAVLVHCDAPDWELSRSPEGWDLWVA